MRAGLLDALHLKGVLGRRRSPASASDPFALCRPMVSKLSFTIIGTQCSGPAKSRCARSADRDRRPASALRGLMMTIALMAGPFLSYASMRRRYWLHQRAAGEAAGLHRILDLRDGRLFHPERRERLRLDDGRRSTENGRKRQSLCTSGLYDAEGPAAAGGPHCARRGAAVRPAEMMPCRKPRPNGRGPHDERERVSGGRKRPTRTRRRQPPSPSD